MITALVQSGLILAAVGAVVAILNDWGIGGHSCGHCEHWGEED